jgi:hypothetical protein
MKKVRINLHVYALDGEGATVYHVLHLGFFAPGAVKAVTEGLNIRSIAYHSDIKHQTGTVSVVTCLMDTAVAQPETTERTEQYEPPELRGGWRWPQRERQ